MNRWTALIVLLIASVSAAIWAQVGPAAKGIPYQGRLEMNGLPVTDEVPIRFQIFDAATGGS